MPVGLQEWFRHHVYLSVLVAALAEGLGLPLPSEVVFFVTAILIHEGLASLSGVVFSATIGSTVGALIGFGLAYLGGPGLIRAVAAVVKIKPEAIERVEEFFDRYGAVTVFLSRFVGVIRAATIYVAGAARMEPWKYALWALAAAFVWNAGWAWLFYRFGHGAIHLVRRAFSGGMSWVILTLLALLLLRLAFSWYQSRRKVNR